MCNTFERQKRKGYYAYYIQNSCKMMNRKCQQIQDCSYLMQPTPKKFLHLHFRLETTGWGQEIAGDHQCKAHLIIISTFNFYLTVWICTTIYTPFTIIKHTFADEQGVWMDILTSTSVDHWWRGKREQSSGVQLDNHLSAMQKCNHTVSIDISLVSRNNIGRL